LNISAGELRKRGVKIKLQEQPLQILIMLLLRQRQLVTREELRKTLWPSDTFVDFDHSLNSAIMRLREALGDSADSPRFIETLPKRGYRFTAPVSTVSVDPPQAFVPQAASTMHLPLTEAPITSPTPLLRTRRFRRSVLGGGALLLAVALATGVLVWRQQAAKATAGTIQSLVVLPIENLTGDKDQEFLADGITDELTTNLAKIRSLRVISFTSAMSYKGTHDALPQIAHQLKVDGVIEGTLRKSGNRIRISTELVRAATDRTLWVETYDTELADVISTEAGVAQAIAKEVRITLTPQEKHDLQPHSMNAAAHESYLRGRYYWSRRTGESLRRAISYFQDAINKDPNSALAYAGLADCYDMLGSAIMLESVPTREAYPEAKAAALRAIQLDDSLAEAHTSLATMSFNYDWNWSAAERELERALAINPSYATAHQRYSLLLMSMGRTDQSISEMNRARELDPVSVSINFSLGWRLYFARHYDAAIAQLHDTLDIDPNFALALVVLGEAYEQENQLDAAIGELRRAAQLSGDKPLVLAALGNALGRAGRRAEAEQVLTRIQSMATQTYISPVHIARVYAGLNEPQQAMQWLERGYDDRSNDLLFLKVDPQFDLLRSYPQFVDLLRRIGLPVSK
jgi:TolB-like protein/DNA-binding winged helix-turn-helix (wHTH) protein/Tfp pilus assembly protein PilF